MQGGGEEAPAVRFCPYCGEPLGSFFAVRVEGGGHWCERCQECIRVENVSESEGEE